MKLLKLAVEGLIGQTVEIDEKQRGFMSGRGTTAVDMGVHRGLCLEPTTVHHCVRGSNHGAP